MLFYLLSINSVLVVGTFLVIHLLMLDEGDIKVVIGWSWWCLLAFNWSSICEILLVPVCRCHACAGSM